MGKSNSNVLLALFIVIILIGVIYYLSKNDDQPIHNDGRLGALAHDVQSRGQDTARPINPPTLNTRPPGDYDDYMVDRLVAEYNTDDIPNDDSVGYFSPSDPAAGNYGRFSDYGTKRQMSFRKTEQAFAPDNYDHRDFSYKKQLFTKRTPDDVSDLFDVEQMLPREIEEDWFDIEPLQATKKIRGTHLIHPKVHMGVNTVGSSLKNATHDIRGDIPNPKIRVAPWLQSTIEPDTNLKGICNSI